MRDVLIPYDRLAVVIHAVPPDKRIRDLDNLLKAPLDAITHARAWPDDGLIDRLEIIRYQPEKPGRIVLAITAAETTQRYEL